MSMDISISQPSATKRYISLNPIKINYEDIDFTGYCELLQECMFKEVPDGVYAEKHHPFPRSWTKRLFAKDSDEYRWLMKFTVKVSAYDHALLHLKLYETGEPYQVRAAIHMFESCGLLTDLNNSHITQEQRESLVAQWARDREMESRTHSILMKECHNTKEFKTHQSNALKKFYQSEESRERMRKMHQHYLDELSPEQKEEFNEKRLQGLRRLDVRQKISNTLKERFKSEEVRKQSSNAIKSKLQDPEFVEKRRVAHASVDWKIINSAPEKRQKYSEMLTESWSDGGSRRQRYERNVAQRTETFVLVSPENQIIGVDDLYTFCLNTFSPKKTAQNARNYLRDKHLYKKWYCLCIQKGNDVSDSEVLELAEGRRRRAHSGGPTRG